MTFLLFQTLKGLKQLIVSFRLSLLFSFSVLIFKISNRFEAEVNFKVKTLTFYPRNFLKTIWKFPCFNVSTSFMLFLNIFLKISSIVVFSIPIRRENKNSPSLPKSLFFCSPNIDPNEISFLKSVAERTFSRKDRRLCTRVFDFCAIGKMRFLSFSPFGVISRNLIKKLSLDTFLVAFNWKPFSLDKKKIRAK